MSFLDLPEGRLVVALGIGLVIGTDRERRKGDGPTRTAAGIRTFTLVALLGGVVALLGSTALVVTFGLIVGAATLAGYLLGDRSDPGLTTEVALILTYALGVLAQSRPTVALAAGLSAAFVLAYRARLHDAVRSALTERELLDGLLFAVSAVVILPLLPHHAIDPLGAINPFTLWRLVVILMGMSGAGYIAKRVIGPRYGLALAGFASGFVSSSATVAAMGARLKSDPEMLRPAVAGAAASSVATFIQLAVLIAAASPPLLAALSGPLAAGGGAALAYAALQTFQARGTAAQAAASDRPFKVSSALFFAGLVSVVAFVSSLAQRTLGARGAFAATALAGLADAHAASAAMASLAAAQRIGLWGAQVGVLLALTTNTATKAVLAFSSGPRPYAIRVSVGLALMTVAAWGTFAVRALAH